MKVDSEVPKTERRGREIHMKMRMFFLAACLAIAPLAAVRAADLSAPVLASSSPPSATGSDWSVQFTTYGWIPWLSGTAGIKGRTLDVEMNPRQILGHLDWSQIPAWMSYVEARRGPISLFNDIVYSKLAGNGSFAKSVNGRVLSAELGAGFQADYEQATIEAGGAYQIWSGTAPGHGATAVDVLAGVRYWHQKVDVSVALSAAVTLNGPLGIVDLTRSGSRVFARSGSVDWVDPFVGMRVRQQLAPGQELVLRGDVGGFGVGSDFSWQALATYNFQMMAGPGYVVDGYLGYRALAVDYAQGSGSTRYEYNTVMQGPVTGVTVRF